MALRLLFPRPRAWYSRRASLPTGLRSWPSRTRNARYYYLSDHLGSVRVTLKEDGSVDSWSDYYPFGKESRGSSTVNEPKEQFTGKERDSESGLDYFGARYYNSEIGRWLATDPMGIKYPDLSPYVYAVNNPLRVIDIDGRDVIVLSAPSGARDKGHMAVLIGNDNNGWYLYSKNGTYGSSGTSGASDKNPQTGVYFESLDAFANHKTNFTEEGDVYYTGAYRIESDVETDATMMDAAADIIEEPYDVTSVVSTNCADVPSAALSAGGFDPGSSNPVPNSRYNDIKEKNNGKDVSETIVPKIGTKLENKRDAIIGKAIKANRQKEADKKKLIEKYENSDIRQ
ncbi:RHS repeat-associated core domain-containing protein [bacterium]|nr:RHS repeat-associated core domain-containing protein [bacterium]